MPAFSKKISGNAGKDFKKVHKKFPEILEKTGKCFSEFFLYYTILGVYF
jgi:hypothetical protein